MTIKKIKRNKWYKMDNNIIKMSMYQYSNKKSLYVTTNLQFLFKEFLDFN